MTTEKPKDKDAVAIAQVKQAIATAQAANDQLKTLADKCSSLILP